MERPGILFFTIALVTMPLPAAGTPLVPSTSDAAPGGSSAGIPQPISRLHDADCTPHPPIQITEDEGPQGFILGHDPVTGEPIHRPGSGVVAGDGTAESPYEIRGWCIAPNPDGTGLLIEGVNAHVLIRDNVIDGGAPGPAGGTDDPQNVGIELDDAGTVAVVDNRIEGNVVDGLRAADPGGASLAGNTIVGNGEVGARITQADGATVTGNTIAENDGIGLHLARSNGTTISGNTIAENDGVGLRLARSNGTTISGNTIGENDDMGARLTQSNGAQITDNEVRDNDEPGLRLSGSDGATIANNTITGQYVGFVSALRVTGSEGTEIADNTLEDNSGAVELDQVADAAVTGNRIVDNHDFGVRIYESDTTIANNTVKRNDEGIDVEFSGGATVENNTVRGNEDGLEVSASSDMEFHHNNIKWNDENGLEIWSGDAPVNATHNWWGASNGPSSPDAILLGSGDTVDACTGTVADGDGDTIETHSGAEVCFDPWLTEPNPEAGAG